MAAELMHWMLTEQSSRAEVVVGMYLTYHLGEKGGRGGHQCAVMG